MVQLLLLFVTKKIPNSFWLIVAVFLLMQSHKIVQQQLPAYRTVQCEPI